MTTDVRLRTQVLQRGGRFAAPLPDAVMAIVFALAAMIDFLTPEQLASWPAGFIESRDELMFVLLVEGGFLMMQGTLVDIATRLKKRPPIWVIPIIVAAVALFSQGSFEVIRMAWHQGGIVFVPLLLSLIERGAVLWNMPNRSRIEKVAARARIANRITTGLILLGLTAALLLTGVALDREWHTGGWVPMIGGALYFAVAAFDDWRVRGRRFAEHPRVLFGFDPIHIEYLEPV